MIKGIDVSKWNTVNWQAIKDSGYEFVYVKCSEGVGGFDKMCLTHVARAKAVGLKIGLYHFASLNSKEEIEDAKAEAQYFLSKSKDIKVDLLPVIDVETNEVSLMQSEVENWIRTYVDELQGKCVLYSSAGFLNSYLYPNHKLGNIPLWLSSYPFDRTNPKVSEDMLSKLKMPKPPVGWNDYIMLQWTGQGVTKGCNKIDLNIAKTLPLIK